MINSIPACTTNMKPYHDSEYLKHKLITYVIDVFVFLIYIYVQLFTSSFQDQKTFGFLEHTLFSLDYTETICSLET